MKMNTRKKDNLERNGLLGVLQEFVAEAMKYLRQHTDISQIPTVRRYTLHQESGRTKILPSDQPNWWQVSRYMKPIPQLDSYNSAIEACQKSGLLLKRNGQRANALNNGLSFHVSLVPEQFLTECIARENGFRFHKNTVSDVFKSLIAFVSPTAQNKACLVAP